MSGETATAAADAKVEVMDEEVTTGSAGADRGEKLLPVVDIDVCLRGDCVCDPGAVEARVYAFVRDTTAFFSTGPLDLSHDDPLNSFVERAHVYVPGDTMCVPFWSAEVDIHVFQLSRDQAAEEMADNDDDVVACQIYTMPSAEYDGVWESLTFEEDIKRKLLGYASTAMQFSDLNVNPRIIGWNRMVLLHGPPGSGKTSLCTGLAQLLSIRLSRRYPHCQLVSINAHSLFSKWFSESGKLVLKLFQRIQDLVSDETSLVVLLIDEVESLAGARQAALSGSEPSDSIRVVNALLTQLDQLKHKRNVLICCTSNLSQAIDLAFLDRADMRLFIGPPGANARLEILRSCLAELIRTGIVKEDAERSGSVPDDGDALKQLALDLEGISGRSLRRLPFQAQSLYVNKLGATASEFISAMSRAYRELRAHAEM
ncbi:AAA+ ATPase domain-containing protein [Plasmodiophora brassicae]